MFLFFEVSLPAELSIVSVLLLGFVLGLWHAVEADHIAAVATIVSERKNVFAAALVGGVWGIGHTISLLVVGTLVILLKISVSESTEKLLETAVGAMLVFLGANALRKIWSGAKTHSHEHRQSNLPPAESPRKSFFSPRSLVVGMIHGLAGSGALTVLVASSIAAPAVALLFIAVFVIASIGGMMLASLLFGLPLHLTARKFERFNLGLRFLAGAFSLGFGLFVLYENGSAFFV